MQKTSGDNMMAKTAHRKMQVSTTLNRRYVKRPMKSTDVMVSFKSSGKKEESYKAHPMQTLTKDTMKAREAKINQAMTMEKPTAKELKERAIEKALATAAKETTEKSGKKMSEKIHFGIGRVLLALSCAAAAVFAIVYFVNLNMPDISLKVAAMQTGINASYPNYVPRDFSISSITSEEGKISLSFKNSTSGDEFVLNRLKETGKPIFLIILIEEKSSWDSNALLTNYVKEEFGEDYTIVREQGLTLYTNASNAAWVNGGILYKIKITSGTLTNKQIRSIATSL